MHENPLDQPLSTHEQEDQGRDLPRQQHPSRAGPKTGLCCAEIWQGRKKKKGHTGYREGIRESTGRHQAEAATV